MKQLVLFAMWLVASLAAIGVAWAGVSVVDNQVVDPPSADFAASSVVGDTSGNDGPESLRQENGSASSTSSTSTSTTVLESTTTSSTSDTGSGNSIPSAQATQPTVAQASSGGNAVASSPSSRVTPTNPPASSTSTTTNPPASSTSTNPPAPSSTQAAPTTTQTFSLVGGTTSISFSSSGVQVLWATPNPGFTVKIEPESPGMKVEFRSDQHRSRVDAWWSGGPQNSIREEAD